MPDQAEAAIAESIPAEGTSGRWSWEMIKTEHRACVTVFYDGKLRAGFHSIDDRAKLDAMLFIAAAGQ